MAQDTVYYTTNTWNLARSIASTALDLTEQSVETPDESVTIGELYEPITAVYQEHQSEARVWPFSGPMDLLALVDKHLGLDAENRELNDLAKAISTRIQDDPTYEHQSDPDESTTTDSEAEPESEATGTQFDEDVRTVAERLYQCFVAHNTETGYREIQADYDSPFPHRSVALTLVANSKGDTKEERVEDIAEWVNEWFNDPEQVETENQFARKPMGKRVGT